MQGLGGLGSWVDQLASALRLPQAQEYALRLCLEEAVANVVMHGEPDPGAAQDAVAVQVCGAPDALHVTIEDGCAAFDPLRQPAPGGRRSLEEEPGGWGIQLMRQFAASMAYQRVNGTNRLTLTIGREGGDGGRGEGGHGKS